MFCFFWLWGMWGICSLTRDWAHTLCIGSSLNHRPSGKSLKHFNDRRIIVVNGSLKATCAKHWAQHKWSRYSLRDDWLFCRATVIDKESVQLNHVQLFATPWTVAHQAPLSMGFSGEEYWSVLPFPSPGDLPNPGIELRSPTLQADTLTSEPPGVFL